jgi:choline dehydrogenase-like flavoprotein
VADALKSGNTTLITNAMVYRVLMDPDKNVANGVLYIDRNTHEVKEVHARVVILCAQALESTRILLNSTSTQYPNGLANSSGALGHYLMDHVWVAGGARGEFPDAAGPKPSMNAPKRPTGIYAIRMHNTANGPRSKDFIRGFGFQGGGSTDFNMNAPGYGAAFKTGVFDPVTTVALAGFGEALARWDNFVEIDKNVVDKFGIPVLRLTMSWGENEKKIIPAMARTASEMMEAAGAKNITPFQVPNRVPGYGIHEMGTARMGADSKTSILNGFCQTHDVKNLYVTDASAFVSSGCQNPTLTIMALTVRAMDHLMQEMKSGNV